MNNQFQTMLAAEKVNARREASLSKREKATRRALGAFAMSSVFAVNALHITGIHVPYETAFDVIQTAGAVVAASRGMSEVRNALDANSQIRAIDVGTHELQTSEPAAEA